MRKMPPILLAIILVWLVPLHAQRCDRCMKDGIEIPISLAKGTIRTPEFPVRRSSVYNIVIDVRWLLPTAELRCKMGFAVSPSDNQCDGQSLLRLSWRVLDGNQIVAEGVDDDRNGDFDANSRSLIKHIGHFKGKAKHRYVVEVTFKEDASQLNVTQPHLIVETPDSW